MIIKKTSSRTKFLFAAIAIVCACTIVVIVTVSRGELKEGSNSFEYTALGDSIPNGYTVLEDDGLKSYPKLLTEDIKKEEDTTVNLSGYTKNGLTVNGLYEKYLSDTKVQEDLKKADLITVTIGANDILNKFRELYQEVFDEDMKVRDIESILKIIQKETTGNPQILAEVAEIIYGWDCEDFERDWETAMESIRQNRNEDAKVIVTTIYDPVGEMEALGVLNQVIEGMINALNQIIIDESEKYEYQVADLSGIGTGGYLQSDRLHPNQRGQQMILERIKEQYYRK